VRKYGDKLLITPAKSKVKILRGKISALIQSARGLAQEALVRQLNPRLRGWANYFRNGVATRTFRNLDWHVYRVLWRWVHRRHPHKSVRWKKHKYFSAAEDSGVFSMRVTLKNGESRVLAVYQLASTKIERHIKVRGTAHPYDPNYTEYFEKRRYSIWRTRWGGRKTAAVTARP